MVIPVIFKAVGFPHEQAETLADIIEESHVDGQQGLKEFINNKFDTFSKEIRSELKSEISGLEAKLRASQADLLLKYSAIIAGFVSIALATAKLLW